MGFYPDIEKFNQMKKTLLSLALLACSFSPSSKAEQTEGFDLQHLEIVLNCDSVCEPIKTLGLIAPSLKKLNIDPSYKFTFVSSDGNTVAYTVGEILILLHGTGLFSNSSSLTPELSSFQSLESTQEIGGELLFDEYEHYLKEALETMPVVQNVTQKYLDSQKQARSYVMNTLTWTFFGTVSLKVGIKVAGESGFVAQALASLTGASLSAVFNNDIPFYTENKRIGDKMVFLNGQMGLYRNGEFLSELSTKGFQNALLKLPNDKKNGLLRIVGSSSNAAGGSSGGGSNYNFGSNESGSRVSISCRSVSTGSGAGWVSDTICWPVRA
ncbi:hypothetical protein [Pseudoalteromonas sp. MSK9-3]|uniref:hypothetical protein n=1 Tax=Pseudoalteromonas sp. MSK9-3 TaxID=1897633 RepID=UPI0011C3B47C|nr:hypothetical protein [Pseudoalteromonas sp. MSK9-3]